MTSTPTQKSQLYQYIIAACDQLEIARYLKNEIKNSLQYLHTYKLKNIKKNLTAFTEYLLFLNKENCQQINALAYLPQIHKTMNNNLSYFYHHQEITPAEKEEITQKIESNSYQTITLMQGIKGLLLLTIDEFCNASPTRMAINTFIWQKQEKKAKK
ncbi:MAG: hypothetical protein LBD75_05695 [Candidatus Peribacteria bacterium]|jgi:hypothetical protein|nr:hypothetical protein [Candidatus Peribacteria bacterium]